MLPKEYTEEDFERNLENELQSHLDIQQRADSKEPDQSSNATNINQPVRAGLPQNFKGVSRRSPGRMNLKDLKSPMGDIFQEGKYHNLVDEPKFQIKQREAHLLRSLNNNRSPSGLPDKKEAADFQIKLTHETGWERALRK